MPTGAELLAADLYNAIVDGYVATFMRMNYRNDGWTLRIRRLGGLIKGDVVVSVQYAASDVRVELSRLWGRRCLGIIPLTAGTAEEVARKVAAMGGLQAKPNRR